MSEAQYCDECGRMKEIGCECGLTFAERMKAKSFRMGDWAPAKPSKPKPFKFGGEGT